MLRPNLFSGVEQKDFDRGLWIDRGHKVVAVFITAVTGESQVTGIIGTA
jgi:hypothetical protein